MSEEDAGAGSLFLHSGLANGVLLRTEMDRVTGAMSDTRTRFLGTRPPKLFATTLRGQRAMLALSSRPWLGYSHMGRFNLTPLSYEVRLAPTTSPSLASISIAIASQPRTLYHPLHLVTHAYYDRT